MKKELAIGICFGLAGILCTCLFGYEYFTTYGFLNAYHMKAFAASDTRVFAAFGKYFMGKGKSVCDYYNPFPYCFKSNSAIIIALPDLFYRRGIFAACVMNMGILGIGFFSGIVAAAWNFVSCSACAFTAGRTAQVL